ncbi:MAG: BlaI family penicillinase repressor [Enterobacterales bacterium]|jgi:BlaI family penicillinase repressor
MKINKNKIVPTPAELNLLNVLWRLSTATVREVHDLVNKTHVTGYTTILKMFQIMHEKGLVSRDETNRAHIYKATYSEVQTQSSIVKDILNKAFGGSKYDLVVRALGEKISSNEIAEIRQLLDSLEQSNK